MDHSDTERLPVGSLLALATTGFLTIMTETIPAGLLPRISDGLGVGQDAAGQLVTAYAVGSLLSAVPLVRATLCWRRRRVLMLAVGGLLVFNSVTAVSGSYVVSLGARFCAGVAAGLGWGVIASIARRLAAPDQRGKAISLAMAGTPIALALGVPAGTFGGDLLGWRATFAALSVLALLLLAWIRLALPDLPGETATGDTSLRAIATRPGVPAVMAVIVAWMFGHNVLYTYVASFAAGAGLGGRVDLVLLLFGVAALLGLWLTGRLVDRLLRACTLLSLAAFAAAGAVLFLFAHATVVVLLAIAVWGLTFGGASPLLNTAAADAAGEDADLVLAMVTTVWNIAIAAGGLAGGLLLGALGPVSLPLALAISALAGLFIAWRSERHGFPS